MSTRDAIVSEARSWIGTPFIRMAGRKGVGVDCVMLVVRVYQAVGIIPLDFDPRPYPSGLVLAPDDRRFARGVFQYCTLGKGTPLPGDFLTFKLDHAVKHGAIVTEWPLVVHPAPSQSIANRGAVVETSADHGEFAGADFIHWVPLVLAKAA